MFEEAEGLVAPPDLPTPSISITRSTFSGVFWDSEGRDEITWEIVPSTRRSPPGQTGYELHAQIRGVGFWGYEPDSLEPTGADAAAARGFGSSDLTDCIVSGDPTCVFEIDGAWVVGSVTFRLDLTPLARPAAFDPKYLRLRTAVTGEPVEVLDDWFEGAVAKLEAALPENVRIRSCYTCLFSDYSPGGHGALGMRCHRDAKDQYLAVESKGDCWRVPVTEDVPETHLCDDYARRVEGTGYRGKGARTFALASS
jgi:hypothetical protein